MENQTDVLDNGIEEQPKKKGWKTVLIVFCCILVFACAVLGVLQLGVVYCRNTWEQWNPDYAKEDISGACLSSVITISAFRISTIHSSS